MVLGSGQSERDSTSLSVKFGTQRHRIRWKTSSISCSVKSENLSVISVSCRRRLTLFTGEKREGDEDQKLLESYGTSQLSSEVKSRVRQESLCMLRAARLVYVLVSRSRQSSWCREIAQLLALRGVTATKFDHCELGCGSNAKHEPRCQIRGQRDMDQPGSHLSETLCALAQPPSPGPAQTERSVPEARKSLTVRTRFAFFERMWSSPIKCQRTLATGDAGFSEFDGSSETGSNPCSVSSETACGKCTPA